MDPYKVKKDIAFNAIENALNGNKDCCYSIIGEYDQAADQDIATGIPCRVSNDRQAIKEEFERHARIALYKIGADRVRIKVFAGKTPGSKSLYNGAIEITPQSAEDVKAENESAIQAQLNAMLEKINGLAGVAESKNSSLTELKHKQDINDIRTELEINKYKEKIVELENELRELSKEHEEAVTSLSKFQEMYDSDNKLQSSARSFTAILQGVASVAPGLIGYAAKINPALGGLAGALMPQPPAEIEATASPAGPATDYSSPEFLALQHIIGYCKSLSSEQLAALDHVFTRMEADPSVFADITTMYQ